MVNFVSFVTTAAILSSFNLATALPRPGSGSGYSSGWSQGSSSGMNSHDNAPPPPSSSDLGSSSDGYRSNSGYGSSSGYSSSQGNDYGAMPTPTMMDSSPTMLVSSMTVETVSTSTASVMYGSGSMNYGSGSSDYNNCVAQCMASFPPSATAAPPPPPSYGNSGNSGQVGTGTTRTVIVAPTQGVLRYVPFAMNASVGDTIVFMWGANNHTVTKGSALLPCNATSPSDGLFTTGEQNKGFMFTQVVNDTNPTFFHCGTPGHCEKGMFGIINPPSALDAPTSVSGMMQSLTAQNSTLNTYASITDAATTGSRAATWGGNIDISSMPDWSQSLVAENVLYTRNLLASNPDIFKEDGTIDLSNVPNTPLMYPADVDSAVQNAGATSTASDSPSSTSVASAAAETGSSNDSAAPQSKSSNGASSTAPKALAVLVVVLATVFNL